MTRRTGATALVGAVLGGAALIGALVGGAIPAHAATSPSTIAKSFDAGDIISDQVMFNPNAMTQAQVQSFLNAKVPTCQAAQYSTGLPCLKDYTQTTFSRPADPMCKSYQGASNETAAAIIVKVGRSCNINPQALLVILQKEQGLVTDTWPTSSQYRKATGYGCPDDTATCDATYNGFYNQVYKAAWALQRYTMPKGTGPGTDYYSVYARYPVGQAGLIAYQDPYTDASCGSKMVTVKNKATHSLYYYTPYTPNAAALAAGYGSGDACSAYGNRNFYLYFTQWFGSTHIVVSGAIKTYWAAHSGALGAASANAVTSTANGGGTSQTFQHGTVYTSKAGTFAITGALLTEYNRRGGVKGSLQWPAADQTSVAANGGGLMQKFGSGELYSSPAGTYAVRGDLRAAYLAQGGDTGVLGFPSGNAATLGTGWVQHFTKGATYFNGATGGFGVPAAVDKGYGARKGPTGPLGWPRKSPASRTAAGISGTVQTFEHGDLYASSAGTAAVMTPVRAAFTTGSDGFDQLGWPESDATASTANGGGLVQVFTAGRLYVPTGKPALSVTGGILSAYVKAGEGASSLGWPASAALQVMAHGKSETVQSFASGAAYLSGSTVTTVTGALYREYLAEGGPSGSLGWVTGSARRATASGGGWTQTFSGGTLYSSSSSAKTYPLTGAILRLYVSRGEAAGSLGWPISGSSKLTAHGTTKTVQSFQGGAAYLTGSSVTTVTGGLYKAYLAAGGPSGSLGWVTGPAHRTSVSGGGWTQTFSGGVDYYSSKTGKAYPVTGAMLTRYKARGEAAGSFGWPISSATALTAHGATKTVQTFQLGSFTSTGSTVTTVNGGLYQAYLAAGGPAGSVGWVSGSARQTSVSGGGWTQAFTGGTIYFSNRTGRAYPVQGSILSFYKARREAGSTLGWPSALARTVTADGATKTVQAFAGGAVYQTGSHVTAVTGSLYSKYLAERGPSGFLGWVTGSATHVGANGGGWSQNFAHGVLLYSSSIKQSHPVSGGVLDLYAKRGGATGSLGWPVSDPSVNGSVTTQRFQHGTITATAK